MKEAPHGSVGTNVRRPDGAAKASGEALYVDDLVFPGMLHGRTIRSTIAKGRVTRIGTERLTDGFVVVDHRDIPGLNLITLIEDDQPCLVAEEVRHVAEPIVLIAHEDREALNSAIIDIDYDEEPAVLDPTRSDVVQKSILVTRGDPDAGLAAADLIVEGEYTTGHQEQLYIETNGVIAVPEANGGVTIYGSLQCPFYVRRALVALLGLPPKDVRIVQAVTGGGFGGKEEYPSMLAGHAALLALKAKRPVKMIYDRTEDMLATTKRHPFRIRHRTGVKRDGTITAVDIDVLCDGGAYVTLTPVVLSRGVLHSVGPYRCENLRIAGRAVMTNTPPNGAFRGFGAPQTQFAAEVHMERVAEALGMDPVALREHNALRPGDATITGGRIGPDGSALEVLREAVRKSDYHAKRAAYAGTDRGIGLALFFHGSGFTGDGEKKLASEAAVELTADGVEVLAGTCEIGQGTRTIHAQIVADVLGIPASDVRVVDPDTARVPDSGPTVASRTCMVVGGILERCALEMRERLGGLAPADYFAKHGGFAVLKRYEAPPGLSFDEINYVGDAYGTYAWACDVAEVELDRDTWQVRPLRITAVQDIGKAIHPRLATGQIEGGTAQGVGFGLIEEVVMKGGAMANASLTNYLIPTTLDTPRIDVTILEHAYRHGPFGAKGVGELPIDGPAPALLNALRQLGADLRDLPATPERVMEALCD